MSCAPCPSLVSRRSRAPRVSPACSCRAGRQRPESAARDRRGTRPRSCVRRERPHCLHDVGARGRYVSLLQRVGNDVVELCRVAPGSTAAAPARAARAMTRLADGCQGGADQKPAAHDQTSPMYFLVSSTITWRRTMSEIRFGIAISALVMSAADHTTGRGATAPTITAATHSQR